MDTDVLLFCLMGGIVSADTEAAWQVMVSQPLVACSIAGFLMGNLALGLTVGLLLQLPFLIELPIGAAKVSFGNLGAYVSSGLALKLGSIFPEKSNSVLLGSLFFGVLISWASSPLLGGIRQFNLSLLRQADLAAKKGNFARITRLNYLGVIISFVFGLLFSAIFFFLGKFLLFLTIRAVSSQMESAFHLFKPALLGAGLGAMFKLFLKRKTIQYTALGAVVSSAILLIVSMG